MPIARIAIDASQFPENIRRDLLTSLATRRINHKFHYDSVKQTQKWLALHQVFSPSRNNPDCQRIYDEAFAASVQHIVQTRVHVIGLGCGGGQKDTRLLKSLKSGGRNVSYAPCDVSTAMVLTARQAAMEVVSDDECFPLVLDLATADDLAGLFDRQSPAGAARLITFFGMIPNFEPAEILPRLVSMVREQDWLLFSANMSSELDYAADLPMVVPQYDNSLTRDWLMTFLLDLGVDRSDGELRFKVESDPVAESKRITASFYFSGPREIAIENQRFSFSPGDSVRLFFSYRYTQVQIRSLLERQGLRVANQWIMTSEEEGVFLCRRS
jgi:L-histidine N-alpha-methyltransferase